MEHVSQSDPTRPAIVYSRRDARQDQITRKDGSKRLLLPDCSTFSLFLSTGRKGADVKTYFAGMTFDIFIGFTMSRQNMYQMSLSLPRWTWSESRKACVLSACDNGSRRVGESLLIKAQLIHESVSPLLTRLLSKLYISRWEVEHRKGDRRCSGWNGYENYFFPVTLRLSVKSVPIARSRQI